MKGITFFILLVSFSSLTFSQTQHYFYSHQTDNKNALCENNSSIQNLCSKEKGLIKQVLGKSGYFAAINLNNNLFDQIVGRDSVKFFLKFDNYCFLFVLFNENFWISDGEVIWNPDRTLAEFTAPQGAYQFFSYSENPSQNQNMFMIKEDILISQSDTFKINYSDAQNAVVLENLDENGNVLPVIQEYYLNPTEIYFSRTGFHFVFWGYTFFNIYCSDFSEEVHFSCGLSWTDFLDTKKIYVINHDLLKGLNNSVTLINNPLDFIEHNLDVLCNRIADSTYIGHIDFMRFGGDTLFGFGGTVKIAGNNWKGKLFSTSFNSNYTGFCTGLFSMDIQRNFIFATNPIQTESVYTFTYWIAGLNNTPPNIIKYPDKSEINLGYIASYADAFLFNTENSIFFGSNYFGLTNEIRYDDLHNSYFQLFDFQNSLIAEGIVENFPSLFLDPNKYFLKTINNNFKIAGEPAELVSSQHFDLRNEDKNPPFISSLNIIDEQGVPSRRFEKNSLVKLSFSANDIELNGFVIDSTEVLIRISGTSDWQNLLHNYILYDERIGYLYESDLTPYTNYDSASIDLKFIFTDLSKNVTELLLQPAIGIGKYGTITNVVPNFEFQENAPQNFILYQNYPNPFNPTTTIKFALPIESKVKINVYNSLGQLVETLVDNEMESGYHEVNFDASRLASGIYLYQLQAGDYVTVKKMILIK
jgi:hypothetical protein